MPFHETDIPDVKIFEPQVFEDKRGYFFESYNAQTFQKEGQIEDEFVQDNQSKSNYGVLRGLHYQIAPYAQAKLLRVLKGEILDVAVDIREGSDSYGEWVSHRLSADNKKQMYVPRGFAHGFSVLSDQAIVFYKCDNFYSKEHERGIRYDEPALGIDWQLPADDITLSEKDQQLPALEEAEKKF
jgi:dTDP-4-dehydrorhamnose 3,5-epimerase